MKTIKDVLRDKGQAVWTIDVNALVLDALELMAEKEIGALMVMEDGRVAGVMSERDYARKVVLLGRSSKDTPVREIMTRKVLYVKPEQTVEECMALMTEKHVRHMPVLDGDSMIGVVSIGDIVKSVISEQQFLISHLENYIRGK
ncbi:MAG: inosine-5-monophosphate dehydrogenase [Acidobacteria bacterium]|jgi:CBS domain-containing protein|nr:inosine-5-monophosphate dehydrogenase [Acidobacteriota bacterium]